MSKEEREKDEKRLLELMEQLEKVSWNEHIVDEALALAWKYFHKCERQAMEINALKERLNEQKTSNGRPAEYGRHTLQDGEQ